MSLGATSPMEECSSSINSDCKSPRKGSSLLKEHDLRERLRKRRRRETKCRTVEEGKEEKQRESESEEEQKSTQQRESFQELSTEELSEYKTQLLKVLNFVDYYA